MSLENRFGQGRQHYKREMQVKLDILWNDVVKSDPKSKALRFRLYTNHGALHVLNSIITDWTHSVYEHNIVDLTHCWSPQIHPRTSPRTGRSPQSRHVCAGWQWTLPLWMTIPQRDCHLKVEWESLFWDLRKTMSYPYPQWIHISQETVVNREV